MDLKDAIRNGILSAPRVNPVPTNAPHNSGPRGNHWSVEAALMYQTIAPYAGNVFDAQIQGLDYENFYEWQDVVIRSAPVVDATTGDNMSEDWQRIMIIDRKIDFIPVGAYVRFNNNVWIVYNPDNVASDLGTAVVQRCNVTYNTLDWYGNVVKTPMSVSKGKILASSPYYMEYSSIMDGYGHILMQYNDATKDLHDNTRVLLGNSAYAFYGVVNYAQEFTGDDDSVHIIKADIRVNEITENDDRARRVADGSSFRFFIEIGGLNRMPEGETQTLTPHFFRNGGEVFDTAEHPLTVSWQTDDESVATISEDGVLTANAVGSCKVTATLGQNDSVIAEFSVEIEQPMQNGVQFVGNVPDCAGVFTHFPVEAAYFENGIRTNKPVLFSVSGVPDNAVSISPVDANTITVEVWTASGTMTLTASCEGSTVSADIVLEGF